MAGGNRYYFFKRDGVNKRYLRVTTIIDLGIPKPALIGWAARVTAEAAYDGIATLYSFQKRDDREAAVDWLKSQRFRKKEEAALKGTQIHTAIEAYKLGRPYPGVPRNVRPFYDGFLRMLNDQRPIVLQTEANVFNDKRVYAGTLDTIMVWPNLPKTLAARGIDVEEFYPQPWKDPRGPVLVGDYKSGWIYPEVALQLTGYRNSEFIGGPDGAVYEMPETDGGIAIALRPGYTEVIPVETSERVWNAFLFAYEIARWQEDISKNVIGKPLLIYEAPPGPENPDDLVKQIGELWDRLAAAEAELADPLPEYKVATSGRGADPKRHAIADPPPKHQSGKQYAALCGGQVAKPDDNAETFNPYGRNVCGTCAAKATERPAETKEESAA